MLHRSLPPLLTTLVAAVAAASAATQSPAIEGVVADAQGRPILGARVQVSRIGETKAEARATLSGDGGRFRIETERAGSHRIEVAAAGFSRAVLEPVETGVDEVRIALEPLPGSLRGAVVDAAGDPVAGAEVTTMPNSDATDCWSYVPPITHESAKTDAEGRFHLEGLAPGRYRLQIAHPEFALSWQWNQTVHSDRITPVGIELERGTAVSGEVRVSGQVAAGVKVTITRQAAPLAQNPGVYCEVATDEKGRFVFPHRLRHGAYQVMAARPNPGFPLQEIVDFNKSKTEIWLEPGVETFSLPLKIEK